MMYHSIYPFSPTHWDAKITQRYLPCQQSDQVTWVEDSDIDYDRVDRNDYRLASPREYL